MPIEPSKKTLADMKSEFLKHVENLWKTHLKEALELVEEDEEKPKVKLGFSVTLDFTDTVPKLTTKLRFAHAVTDERVAEFDDPNQLALGWIDKDARKKN